jgi:hypothetical protein
MKRTLLFACCVSSALAGCSEESGPAPTGTTGSPTADVTAVSEADWVDPQTGTTYVMNPNRTVVLGPGALAPQTRELPGRVAEVRGAVSSGGFDSDWSGQLQTQVAHCVASQTTGSVSIGCSVSPDFVLIGGGAQDVWTGAGAMLWESHPQDVNDSGPGRTWIASSKDHIQAALHTLNVWAIGLKVKQTNGVFLTAAQLKSHISYRFCPGQTQSDQPSESCDAMKPLLIGGGARSNWQITFGAGQLLTASRVNMNKGTTWLAASKAHIVSDPSTLDVWAISIDPSITGVGQFAWGMEPQPTFTSSGVGTVSVNLDSGTVATCYGGVATWGGINGRMLFQMAPSDGTIRSATASTKDHLRADSGNTTVQLLEMEMATLM